MGNIPRKGVSTVVPMKIHHQNLAVRILYFFFNKIQQASDTDLMNDFVDWHFLGIPQSAVLQASKYRKSVKCTAAISKHT